MEEEEDEVRGGERSGAEVTERVCRMAAEALEVGRGEGEGEGEGEREEGGQGG